MNQPLPRDPADAPYPLLALRSAIGGVLMGLANLVPGISGGTMLLAAGVYPRFINAIAEVTTLRFRPRSLLVLGIVVCSAMAAIVLLAGPTKDAVVNHRWIMYSVFIGLTLGGVPVVWRLIPNRSAGVWVGAALGLVCMVALALAQSRGASGQGASSNAVLLGLAGLAGASAMILPGVSGGYLLLVLGQYVPILGAIDTFKVAIKDGDYQAAMDPALHVFVPVGIGVVVGVVVVSNLLRLLLTRLEGPTLGFLLGLLLGAVVGLYPFQRGETPEVGAVIKGQIVSEETLADIDAEDYPVVYFTPTPAQIGGSLALVLGGVLVTTAIARLGREKRVPESSPPDADQAA